MVHALFTYFWREALVYACLLTMLSALVLRFVIPWRHLCTIIPLWFMGSYCAVHGLLTCLRLETPLLDFFPQLYDLEPRYFGLVVGLFYASLAVFFFCLMIPAARRMNKNAPLPESNGGAGKALHHADRD